MSKILLVLTALIAVLSQTIASATKVRRRVGGGFRGVGSVGAARKGHSARQLQYSAVEYVGFDPRAKIAKSAKGSKGKGKGSKGSGGGPILKKSAPKCRPVVEGAEFIIEGAITMTMANMTEDSSTPGSEFIYNGPLLEFNEQDELTELENFFFSGSCIRTQERNDDMPGAGHCSFTITLDTGATMNFGGEAFDGWDNLMAINGGSQELIGVSGTVTLIGLNSDFEDSTDDFFSVPWIYGEAVLVYQICPQGYWDRWYIQDHDALPPPSIPDPFQRNAEQVETQVVQVVAVPPPADDDARVGDDGALVDDGYY